MSRPAKPEDRGSTGRETSSASTVALFEMVYEELRAVAERFLNTERADHTLAATALVHEVFMRLADVEDSHWADRNHFMVVAVRALRRVLISYARQRSSERRGGSRQRVELEDSAMQDEAQLDRVLEIHSAIESLKALDSRQATVVELRFFAGLSIEDTARILGVSRRTVIDDWAHARAWLHAKLGRSFQASS